MTILNIFTVIAILGAISIIWRSVKRHGIIVGIVYGIFGLIPWAIAIAILVILAGGFNMALDSHAEGPEQHKEQWRQEQIAATGEDPCARTYDMERQRRYHQELIDTGQINDAELLQLTIASDTYAGLDADEKRAALDHDHKMSQKCPPLDYLEKLEQN